jgi:hypothetical protein
MKIGNVIYVDTTGYNFEKRVIIGETTRSWVTLSANSYDLRYSEWFVKEYAEKLPKNGKGYKLGTKREADLQAWARKHAYHISKKVDSLRDHEMLLTIARMLGYESLLEETI